MSDVVSFPSSTPDNANPTEHPPLEHLIRVPTTYVTSARNARTGEEFFIKVVRSNTVLLQEEILQTAKRVKNGAFMTELLATFSFESPERIFLFRKCHYGSLNTVLSRIGHLPMHVAHFVKIAYSLVSALDFLHSKELSHGFLTTQHCLVDELGYVRLCGLSNIHEGRTASLYRWIDNDKTGYFAPEIMDDQKQEFVDPFLVDMFACGVILHVCLTGCFPDSVSANDNAVAPLSTTPSANSAPTSMASSNVPLLSHRALPTLSVFPPIENFRRTSMPPVNNAALTVPPRFSNNVNAPLKAQAVVSKALKAIQRLLNDNPGIRLRAGAFLCSPWLQKSIQQEEKCPSLNSLFFA